MKEVDKWEKIKGLGIVDMIKYSWGNDRYEFDEEMESSMKNYLNENYKCFGRYRTEYGVEAANYLYFDNEGKFESIFYHQDDFDELLEGDLNPMMKKSLANQTFWELTFDAFDVITELKKE